MSLVFKKILLDYLYPLINGTKSYNHNHMTMIPVCYVGNVTIRDITPGDS